MATLIIPRTSPTVAFIRFGPSAFAILRPRTPDTMAPMPRGREMKDAIMIPATPDDD
jgi:hypothetical protein